MATLRVAIFCKTKIGRGERIRTSDPLVPNQVLYQAEPLPDFFEKRWAAGLRNARLLSDSN